MALQLPRLFRVLIAGFREGRQGIAPGVGQGLELGRLRQPECPQRAAELLPPRAMRAFRFEIGPLYLEEANEAPRSRVLRRLWESSVSIRGDASSWRVGTKGGCSQ